jgi:hypothetical protein
LRIAEDATLKEQVRARCNDWRPPKSVDIIATMTPSAATNPMNTQRTDEEFDRQLTEPGQGRAPARQ